VAVYAVGRYSETGHDHFHRSTCHSVRQWKPKQTATRDLVTAVMNLLGSFKVWEFLKYLSNYQLLKEG
jgi:hypothetical protein